MEQFLGVAAGNFQAVRFTDGSLVEPVGSSGHILRSSPMHASNAAAGYHGHTVCEVLELSTKVAADTASSAYSQLKQLAGTKGLSLSSIQTPKTVSALESIVHATGH